MTESQRADQTNQPGSGPRWRTSTFSGANGDCVQVAALGSQIAVRHSKRPDDGVLIYTRAELAAFIAGCKAGEFDDLVHP